MRMHTSIEIGREEFQKRTKHVQELMREEEIDVIIAFGHASEPQYVRYLADFWPTFETAGVVIYQDNDAILLVGPESKERAETTAKIDAIERMIEFRESTAPMYSDKTFFTFEKLFSDCNWAATVKTIGIAGYNFIPMTIYHEIEKAASIITSCISPS